MSQRLWIAVIVAVIGLPREHAIAEDVVVGDGTIVVKGDAIAVGGIVVEAGVGVAQFQIQIQANQINAPKQANVDDRAKAAKPVNRPQQVRPQPVNVDVDAANGDLQAAARARQRQEQAKQFEGLLQPMLRAELELARKSCGSLVPKVRAEVLAAGRATVKEVALELATRQMNGRMGTFDARQRLRDAVRTALKPHATTAELAAYDREETLRETRRADVARVQIIAKVDDELELSDAQRKAIEEHLVRSWDTAWIRELNDAGNMVNNRRIAPDYAERAIVPHLDASQRDEWKAWCQVAGSRMLGNFQNWHWYNQGLTQADPWWGPWTP